MATFNSRGDQADHAQRASRAALALQLNVASLVEQHPDWPRLRAGVNSGGVIVHEVGSLLWHPALLSFVTRRVGLGGLPFVAGRPVKAHVDAVLLGDRHRLCERDEPEISAPSPVEPSSRRSLSDARLSLHAAELLGDDA